MIELPEPFDEDFHDFESLFRGTPDPRTPIHRIDNFEDRYKESFVHSYDDKKGYYFEFDNAPGTCQMGIMRWSMKKAKRLHLFHLPKNASDLALINIEKRYHQTGGASFRLTVEYGRSEPGVLLLTEGEEDWIYSVFNPGLLFEASETDFNQEQRRFLLRHL